MIPELQIMGIGIVLVLACVIPGVFLVLRGMSLMSDAISHASLLGIVVVFFLIQELSSPLLVVGASIAGILTVALTEWLISTQRVKKDAAIGLVFPVFFSIGIILITKFAGNVHFDSDCVLFGEIAFAPFERIVLLSVDIGPKALWVMLSILSLNGLFLVLFYKELKISTFDAGLSCSLGFSPVLMHYGIMTMTSITAVGAFESVGSILVVALMITPPATAYLITDRLSSMIGMSMGMGVMAVCLGYGCSYYFNVSISGSMVGVSGVLFLIVLVGAPNKGIMSKLLQAKKQRVFFSSKMVLIQLYDHEGRQGESFELSIANLIQHMQWERGFAYRVARYCVRHRLVTRSGDQLALTIKGREMAREALLS